MSTNAAGSVGDGELFAPWVEWRHERGRRGRTLVTAVNHRDGEGFYVDAAELDPNHRRHAAAVAELRDGGFLPDSARVETTEPRSHIQSGLVWDGADRFVRTVHRRFGHRLFTPRWVVAQIALAAIGVVALVRTIGSRPVDLHAEPAQVPFIIVLGLVAVFIHEFGHAMVTVHYGRHVRAAGLRLHLGAPAFYVDSLDSLLLTRRQRLFQAAAGPWAEWLATAALASLVLIVDSSGSTAALLHRFLVVNTIGIATNLLPFVGLDGALLFADAIGHPDLPYRTRTALTRRNPGEWWILAYSAANAVVAAGLLVMAGYFWWQLFGDLTATLWSQGPVGATAVFALYALVGRDLWTLCSGAVLQSWTLTSRLWSKVVFRCQRRWRVEAINAFRGLPELASLGSTELGIIAGRLQRCPSRNTTVPEGTSHLYLRPRSSVARRNPALDACVVPVTEWHTLTARAVHHAVALPVGCAASLGATAP